MRFSTLKRCWACGENVRHVRIWRGLAAILAREAGKHHGRRVAWIYRMGLILVAKEHLVWKKGRWKSCKGSLTGS